MSKIIIPTEHQEQVALFSWAEWSLGARPDLINLSAIPNGGLRNVITAKKLKAEGVKPGFPDIILPVPKNGYHGLFIELKRQHGGTVNKEQKEWLERLNGNGYLAVVCKGFEEAKSTIEEYLK